MASRTVVSAVLLGPDHRLRLGWRIVAVCLGFFGCVLFAGVCARQATGAIPVVLVYAIAGACVTASVFGLVLLLRRYVDRRSWASLGLGVGYASLPSLFCGLMLGAFIIVVVDVSMVRLGVAGWVWPVQWGRESSVRGLVSAGAVVAASAFLVQGFPEELVFRGYIFSNLVERLPLWATVASSSVIFGSMHVVSSSGATTMGQRLFYAVAVTGLGVMLAVCRTVTGTLWLDVGVHAGFDAVNGRLIQVRSNALVVEWPILLGVLIIAAAVVVAVGQWRRPGHRFVVSDRS